MFETVEIEHAAGVATLWMNRPELHNAFNAQVIGEITEACRQLDADPQVRVVVLAGRGKSFSAGGDITWMRAQGAAGEEANFVDAMGLAGMYRVLSEMNTPTIARVHGAAIGGGMGLAAACDICIAAERALFATSEVRLGIIPAAIGPYVVRAIGERQAYRYFLTAERIGAVRAAEIGLVHELAAGDELDAKVGEIASALVAGGPLAQGAAKALIRAIVNRPMDDALMEDTAKRIASLRSTPEAREGLSAFLEKRTASWAPGKA